MSPDQLMAVITINLMLLKTQISNEYNDHVGLSFQFHQKKNFVLKYLKNVIHRE